MANDSFADHLNVILVGDGASGKTQLVRVLTGRDFLDDYSVSGKKVHFL